jgi:hypothetical protein
MFCGINCGAGADAFLGAQFASKNATFAGGRSPTKFVRVRFSSLENVIAVNLKRETTSLEMLF